MRSIDELIIAAADAWPNVTEQASHATYGAAILSCAPDAGRATLVAAQVTTRSPLGAIAYHSGGLLIDHGWLRVLGAGNERIGGGLAEWNESLGGETLDPPLHEALVVAYDALGGFFALNAGHWEGDAGTIYYLAPDTWEWEQLGLGYSGLLALAFSADFDRFYQGLRWPGWADEVAGLGPDQGLAVYPPLGFEQTPIADRRRRAVPARELWTATHELARQVRGLPAGTSVRIRVRP